MALPPPPPTKSIASFLIPQKIYIVYSLEAPHLCVSNEYAHHIFLWRNKKK